MEPSAATCYTRSPMSPLSWSRLVPLATVGAMLVPFAASAADAPASKCVTAATKASRNAAIVRMETDIKPHLEKPEAGTAIAAYREAIATAWDAMEEPYCGFGKYGAASAVKSFNKSVVRAQSAFATASAAWKKGTAKAVATNAAAPAPAPKPAPAPTPAPVVLSTKMATPGGNIPSGLAFGMRSDKVLLLQKKLHAAGWLEEDYLTGYFGQKTKDAVMAYQLAKKIVASKAAPGAGLVGPKTLKGLNGE